MNRLQKKCFVAATGLHLLLLVIVLVGPAFLASRQKAEDFTVLDWVPAKTIDEMLAGGGSPEAKPPPAPPAPPQPPQPVASPPPPPQPPQPPQPVVRTPPPQPVQRPTPTPEPVEPKRRLPQVSTELITRPTPTASRPKSADRAAQAREEAKHQAAVSRSLQQLRERLSSTTTVEMPGPGGGGPTYANYRDVLGSIYYQAWQEPDAASADAATVVAAVTVARDGSVLSARITKRSGDPAVDRSVQATLERVKFIAPFPEGSKDLQRDFTVNFNAKAKRGLG